MVPEVEQAFICQFCQRSTIAVQLSMAIVWSFRERGGQTATPGTRRGGNHHFRGRRKGDNEAALFEQRVRASLMFPSPPQDARCQ